MRTEAGFIAASRVIHPFRWRTVQRYGVDEPFPCEQPERVPLMLTLSFLLNRRTTSGILAVFVGALAPAIGSAAPVTTLVCTNLVSHVSWRIHIDFARSTVDSNTARISDARISWHDRTDGGNYTLDRKSGDLTVVLASSTGGYFLHDHCSTASLKPVS